MRTKNHESVAHPGKTPFVRECLICKRGVVLDVAIAPAKSPSEDRLASHAICGDCRRKYLPVGVALVNPDTDSIVVVMDEAFKTLFADSCADPRIVYTGVRLLERIHEIFGASTNEEDEEPGDQRILVN